MDKTGMQILKALRKKSSISVLTKPSNYKNFDEVSKRQKEISERADSIFELTKPEPKSGASALRLTPFIKE
jgi:transcriptional regulator NrdR family protein